MNKTEEILETILNTAKDSENASIRFAARAEAMRDVVKFFRDNGLQIVDPNDNEKEEPAEKPVPEDTK